MTITRAERTEDQEAVARHLVEVVRSRFAGEDESLARIVGREPNEVVVLGVLDPREPPIEAPSHPDLPDEPGVPIDILPPSELGVTVWVDAQKDATHLHFDIDVTFSMYLPEYPTWAEQRSSMAADAIDPGDEPEADDEDLSVGDDLVVQPQQVIPSVTAPGHTNGGNPTAGAAPSTSRRTNRFIPVFARRDVGFSSAIDVPLSGGLVTDAGTAQAAITSVVTTNSGRLAYLLKGRSKSGVSLAAIDAGEAAYEAEIDERRSDQAPPLPSVEFLAAAARDPRGGWRVNLTLANTATSASRRDKPAQTIYNAQFQARLQEGTYRNLGFRLSDADWRTAPEVYAHGRFCVGEIDEHTVRTNTWPI